MNIICPFRISESGYGTIQLIVPIPYLTSALRSQVIRAIVLIPCFASELCTISIYQYIYLHVCELMSLGRKKMGEK